MTQTLMRIWTLVTLTLTWGAFMLSVTTACSFALFMARMPLLQDASFADPAPIAMYIDALQEPQPRICRVLPGAL